MKRLLQTLMALLTVSSALAAGPSPWKSPLVQPDIEGVVTLVWGDPQPGQGREVGPFPTLHTGDGGHYRLLLNEELLAATGGLLRLAGRRVAVSLDPGGLVDAPLPAILATAVRVVGEAPEAPAAVTGAQPWVSIACKFASNSSEPRTLAYFQNMYGGTFPQLDHFWRELSYDLVSVEGSTAVGWYTLPKTRAQYLISPAPEPGVYPRIDLDALFTDCTALANAAVNFQSYQGINMMFNDNLDDSSCCSWGGTHCATLDGSPRCWRTTWDAQWGFTNIAVIQHEMGHGFDWPHSSGSYGQTYDNHWDLMSDSWLCNPSDAAYGCYGQHSIAYHLDMAGWMPAFKKVTVAAGEAKTVKLERLARPWTSKPLMVSAQVGADTTNFLTYEVRQRFGYDAQLAGDAVIIHDVDTNRSNYRDAYVIDTDGDGDTSDAGAQFVVGESHTSASGNIYMHVDAALPTGFQISVANNATAHSPVGLAVSGGNGNPVWEPGEQVTLQPTWLNFSASAINGITSSATMAGAVTLNTGTASYGNFAANTSVACSSCFTATATGPRPGAHWDVSLTETLSNGRTKAWTVHIGSSFADVSTASAYYPFIETLYHGGITAGCTTSTYCPKYAISRSAISVFIAKVLSGGSIPTSGYVAGRGSYSCTTGGTSRFADVRPTDATCPAIHYLAARSVVTGCDATRFCPTRTVTRAEMSLLTATAIANRDELVPESYTDPVSGRAYSCKASSPNLHFSDVTPGSSFCRHAHFLWARAVVAGCTTSNYCPTSPVTREQMAVFLAKGFGLQLYGP